MNAESEPSEETVAAHKITYSYDAEDKVTGIRYALVKDGGVAGLEYVYDGNRWLTGVRAVIKGRDEKPLIREYAYDAQGKVVEIKEYPGLAGKAAAGETTADTETADAAENVCITKTYRYDSLDRVTSIVYKKGSEVLESYACKYDKNNQITEKTEINNTPKTEQDGEKENTVTYEYDVNERIKKSEGAKETITSIRTAWCPIQQKEAGIRKRYRICWGLKIRSSWRSMPRRYPERQRRKAPKVRRRRQTARHLGK